MTQTEINFDVAVRPTRTVRQQRETKRQKIENFFAINLGTRFGSSDCHARFGSAFRTRVSDINLDDHSAVRILNHVEAQRDGAEHSWYWGVPR